MLRREEPEKHNKRKRGNKKRKSVFKLLLRTLFILILLFAFTAAGLGIVTVLSCIKDAPDFDPRNFEQPLTSYIYDCNNNEVAALHDGHNRIEVPLSKIPKHLQHAFIAIEDESFYDHIGISIKDIVRATINNLRKQSMTDQGASTITQQLIKNAFLTREKTLERKIQEAWLALKMEQQYSKEEILEFYLNIIYFDHLSYGVEAAANNFFNKSVDELTLAESAMLAGIPRNPGFYSPYRNFDEAKKRQELVLSKMVEYGYISRQEAEEAKQETIELSGLPEKTYKHPYFIDYVELEAQKILTELDIFDDPLLALNRGGLRIYTTLDPKIQQLVEDVLNNEKHYPRTLVDDNGKLQPQAAAVLAEPETGHIKALVGGRDYGSHNQDLRFLSSRQPGSATKPVLAYAPAIEEKILFPGSALDDAPTAFGNYFPENYGLTFKGLVSVRNAITHSYNVPAVQAYSMVTPKVGMDYAKKLGITTFDKRDEGILSLVLGGFTYGVKPIDMAQVFAVFANNGIKIPLTTILRIENHLGQEIYSYKPVPEIVLSETTAYLVTDVLKDVTRRGTAGRVSGGVGRPIAGKTGTTSDNKDGWLVSYTPDYVLSTWIGYDLLTMGSIMNAPRYTINMSIDIMKKIHEGLPVRDFTSPGGISRVTICSKSGLRPSEHCPEEHITSDLFPRGYEPRETCNVHVSLEICTETGLLSTEFCPEVELKSFIQRLNPYIPTDNRWKGAVGRIPQDAELEAPTETCDLHIHRPPGPVGLTISSSYEGGQVTLSWYQPDMTNIAGYNIYRKTAGENQNTDNADVDNNLNDFIKLNQQLITYNSFIDTNVQPGTTYEYKVTAVNIDGVESLPVIGRVTTNIFDPGYPDPPPDNGSDNGEENGTNNGEGHDENRMDNNNGSETGRGGGNHKSTG